jgi:hypothetical protein
MSSDGSLHRQMFRLLAGFEKHGGLVSFRWSPGQFRFCPRHHAQGTHTEPLLFLLFILSGGINENRFDSAFDCNVSRLDHLAWVVPYPRADNRAPVG